MSGSLERERKLDAPPSFSLARAEVHGEEYTLAPAEWRRLHTTYYDTPDLRLVRWGANLRYRAGEGWTLKLPQPARVGASTYRTERVFPGEPHIVPAAALDLAAAMLRGATPQPVIELRTIRTRRAVATGADEVAEIVEDDVRVVRSSAVVDRFRQVEIELRQRAPDAVLDDLSRTLRRAGAGRPDPVPKIVIAIGDRAHEPEFVVPPLRRNATAADVATAALAASVERLVRLDVQLRLDPHADTVHDARVCVRRVRSHLKTFAPVLDAPWADDLRERLRWLSGALSGARDADVLLADIIARAAMLPAADRHQLDHVLEPLRERRSAAYDMLAHALRAPRYIELIDQLIGAAKTPRLRRRAQRRARKVLSLLMAPVWRRLRKQARRTERGGHDHDLHRLRIKAKHARYAAEALVPVAGRAAERFARCAEALQTLLGKQHDAVNAGHALRRHLEIPEGAFVAGEIAGAEQATAERCRRKWPACWERVLRTYRKRRFWT